MTNPLLARWDTPFGLPPFADIRDADFAPAFDAGLAEARSAIAAIAGNPEAPACQYHRGAGTGRGDAGSRGRAVLQHRGLGQQPAREALQRDWPKLSAFSSEITNNRALFGRIDALWQARATLGLSPEQERVLMLYRRMFIRAGAELDGAESRTDDRDQVAACGLGTDFTRTCWRTSATGSWNSPPPILPAADSSWPRPGLRPRSGTCRVMS